MIYSVTGLIDFTSSKLVLTCIHWCCELCSVTGNSSLKNNLLHNLDGCCELCSVGNSSLESNLLNKLKWHLQSRYFIVAGNESQA